MRERKRPEWLSAVAWSGGGALATAALMTAFGPFGTYTALPAGPRALYWFTVIGVIWLQADLVSRLLYGRLRHRLARPLVLIPILSGLLVSLPATAVVLVMNNAMLPAMTGGQPFDIYWKVTLLLIVVGLIFAQITPDDVPAADMPADGLPADGPPANDPPANDPPANDPPVSTTPHAPRPDFRGRYPQGLAGDLLCLEMEDHYLRIHTSAGSGLVLLRMADAERELAGTDGLRVHRSWWVARAAVREISRDGGRPLLHLVNGLAVPVGKTYRARLKAAGWLP